MRGSEMASGRRRVPLVALYTVALAVFSVYVLLDTFVIARTYAAAVTVDKTATTRSTSLVGQELDAAGTASGASQSGGTQAADPATANAADTSSQETDATSSASATSITQVRYEDTTVYVVDVYTNDVTNLLSAFAQDTYGKNVTSTTSAMAQANGATVAINGDYYGARNAGYVIRNGVLYRDTVASSSQEDLVIYSDGSFEIITEGSVTAQQLLDQGAWQVFSFGPGLVENGTVTVDANDEVGRAMASNPRTAIGKVSDGHYVLVVSDGRTNESEGLSLQQLATFMVDQLGVECAYNLDGGGSSTMWYQGEVVNNPTTNGRSIKERSVSDIVYFTA